MAFIFSLKKKTNPVEPSEPVVTNPTLKVKYYSITPTGEEISVSVEEAINQLELGLISRLKLRANNKVTSIDYFICGNYPKFQIWDDKTHHVGATSSAARAIDEARKTLEEKVNESL